MGGQGAEQGGRRRARGRGGRDAAWPPHPTAVDRVFDGGAARAPAISAAPEHIVRHGGRRGRGGAPPAEDPAPRLRVVPTGGRPAAPPVERVVPATPAPTGGLPLWCSMAAVAQQLAAATARQARARHGLERQTAKLERENARLVAEVADATELLAIQAEEHARAARRAGRLIAGLSLAVAALGALLLVLGPLAAVGRLGP